TMGERVAILRQGRLVFLGAWTDLDDGGSVVRLAVDDWARAAATFERIGAAVLGNGTVALAADRTVAELVAALVHAGIAVHAVEPVRRSAEERYLRAVRDPSA